MLSKEYRTVCVCVCVCVCVWAEKNKKIQFKRCNTYHQLLSGKRFWECNHIAKAWCGSHKHHQAVESWLGESSCVKEGKMEKKKNGDGSLLLPSAIPPCGGAPLRRPSKSWVNAAGSSFKMNRWIIWMNEMNEWMRKSVQKSNIALKYLENFFDDVPLHLVIEISDRTASQLKAVQHKVIVLAEHLCFVVLKQVKQKL